MAPRYAPNVLPDNFAQYALNCKVHSGAIVPYRQSRFLLDAPVAGAQSMYPMKTDTARYWLMWTSDVDVTKSPAADIGTGRIYYTGDGVPKVTDFNRATFATISHTTAINYSTLVTDDESTVECTATCTITLYNTPADGYAVLVSNTSASGTVTVNAPGGFTIDGGASTTVAAGVAKMFKFAGSTSYASSIPSTFPYDYQELGVAAPVGALTVDYDILAKSGAYTVVGADAGKTIDCSATPWTLGLTAAATLGADFMCVVRNKGTGDLTVDPNGAELINNATTLIIKSGEVGVIACNGTAFAATVLTTGFKAWVYTYVTAWGEESPPSPASNTLVHTSGQRMLVSGLPSSWTLPNDTRTRYSAVRLYRTNTGTTGTFYQLIAELPLPVSGGNYTDATKNTALGAVLPSDEWEPPPEDMIGVVTMANGMMVGFRENSNVLCFAEPYQPHAWPVTYQYRTDAKIVAIGALGNSVVVTTDGRPHTATGNHPASITVVPVDLPYPCLSKRGLVNMGTSILYPSYEGLVSVASGAPQLATVQTLTRDEWSSYYPDTLQSVFYDGKYYGQFTTPGGEKGVIAFQPGGKADSPALFLRLNVLFDASYSDLADGVLYYTYGDQIYQWDDPEASYLVQDWWSKEFVYDRPENFGAAKVVGDFATDDVDAQNQAIIDANAAIADEEGYLGDTELGTYEVAGDMLEELVTGAALVLFSLYVKGDLYWQRFVSTDRAFRLPAGYKSDRISFRVSGNVPVRGILVAPTPAMLATISES